MKYLQSQIEQLNPANKSVSMIGFKTEDPIKRTQIIENFLKEKLPQIANKVSIEHVYKGKFTDRKISGISIVQFASRQVRNDILQDIQNRNLPLQDSSSNIKFAYAKTKRQLRRNWCINQAKRVLEKDSSTQNKQIHIEWKVGNDKSKRLVKVGDDVAFQQSGDDLSGSFSAAFSHLSLE